MAMWGAPEPVEKSQLRACNSAMQFQQALTVLNAKSPPSVPQVNNLLDKHKTLQVHCRVGIHFGEVLVGNIGYEQRMNYTGSHSVTVNRIISDSVRKFSQYCSSFGTSRKELRIISFN